MLFTTGCSVLRRNGLAVPRNANRSATEERFAVARLSRCNRSVSSFAAAVARYNRSDLELERPLVLGCVSYDPAVSEIWTGIQKVVEETRGIRFDFVLFPSYASQVRALLDSGIDVAWNGPIAHVMCEELVSERDTLVSLGMRDVDRDFQSIVVVRNDSGVQDLDGIKDCRLVSGTSDSPQAHVVPVHFLSIHAGVDPSNVTTIDVDVGKHGDTALGEMKALQLLSEGDSFDAALVSRMMWERGSSGAVAGLDSKLLCDTCSVLESAQIPSFDHCQFDALLTSRNEDSLNNFGEAILAMDMDDPTQGPLMKLEGICKRWVGPRQFGYDIVRKALGVSSHHRPASNFQYRHSRLFSTEATKPGARRVAVIGAGVAGLQVVRALQSRGFPVTAFDAAAKIGGLWTKNYANFGIQVPKQLYEFQDFPMTTVNRGAFASGLQVQSYIEDYASAFGLWNAVQLQTRVVSATQMSDSSAMWCIELEKDGEMWKEEFDFLVVATGLYSGTKKNLPDIPGLEGNFRGQFLHSCDFDDSSMAQNKRVVVIGGGKSAVDCAVEASHAGAATVTLVQRKAHWPTPRKIAGLIPFQYIFLSRFGTALVSAHRGAYPGGSGVLVNAFRNSVGPYIVKPLFRVVEHLFALQLGLAGDLRPKEDIVADFYDTALVLNPDFQELRKNGSVNVEVGQVVEAKDDGVTLKLSNGTSVGADLIVSATGYSHSLPFLNDATLRDLDVQSDGFYLHRYILPDKVPNLAFIGYVAAVSNVSTYGLQAEWLARKLKGDLLGGSTPCQEETRKRREWARSWMPETSKRGMLVLLHQTHYHDQLLRDMGEKPHRKGGIAEFVMPYESADYNGIMGGSPAR
jgi:dimethylaniline monooxygenase (N-oxide forming)